MRKGQVIRQEIQWVVDDAADPANFKKYSSHGGSFQHRESGLVIASDWLATPGFGAVKDHIDLNPEELAAVGAAFQRLRESYTGAERARVWANVQNRFKYRAWAAYQFICSKIKSP